MLMLAIIVGASVLLSILFAASPKAASMAKTAVVWGFALVITFPAQCLASLLAMLGAIGGFLVKQAKKAVDAVQRVAKQLDGKTVDAANNIIGK